MEAVIAIIIGVVLFLRYSDLDKRIKSLEHQILRLSSNSNNQAKTSIAANKTTHSQTHRHTEFTEKTDFARRSFSEGGTTDTQDTIIPIPPYKKFAHHNPDLPHTQPHILSQEPDTDSFDLGKWLVTDWPLKVGAFFIILGFGWLVSYAFINNWIGPVGRIMLGFITGSSIMIGGHYFMRKESHQGLVLEGLGASVLLISIFAAQNIYDMFPAFVALLFTVAVTVFISYSSLTYQDKWLALAAVLIGGIAPLLTGATEPNILNLFSYLFALSLGTLWLVKFSHWNFLVPVVLAIISLYSLPYMAMGYEHIIDRQTPNDITWLRFFALGFTSLFFFSNVAAILHKKQAETVDLITGLGVGLFVSGWISGIFPTHFQSLIMALAAVAFAIATYFIYNATKSIQPLYVYEGTSIFLLTTACIREFDGPELVFALSLLGVILSIFNANYIRLTSGARLSWYLLIPLLLSLPSLMDSYAWRDSIFHWEAFSVLSIILALWITGLFYYQHKQKLGPKDKHYEEINQTSLILIISASIYSLIFIWRINHTIFNPEYAARAITLTIYTIAGLYTYIKGQNENRRILYRYGQILTIFVIGWLLLVEVWEMPMGGRIVTFFSIGALLIGTWITRRKKPLSDTANLSS